MKLSCYLLTHYTKMGRERKKVYVWVYIHICLYNMCVCVCVCVHENSTSLTHELLTWSTINVLPNSSIKSLQIPIRLWKMKVSIRHTVSSFPFPKTTQLSPGWLPEKQWRIKAPSSFFPVGCTQLCKIFVATRWRQFDNRKIGYWNMNSHKSSTNILK